MAKDHVRYEEDVGERQAFIGRMRTIASEIADAWFLTKINDPENMRAIAHKILDANLANLFKFEWGESAKKKIINRAADRLFNEWIESDDGRALVNSKEARTALTSVMGLQDIVAAAREKGTSRRILMWRLHSAGLSLTEIAKIHGTSKNTVRKFLKTADDRRQLLLTELALYDIPITEGEDDEPSEEQRAAWATIKINSDVVA